jgi:tricarboxylate carrier
MSFFVPSNLFIVTGMLSAKSMPAIAFWQFVNQTYNVCFNYSNANLSNPLNTKQLAYSYLLAVTSSVGTAIGMNEWVKRATFSPTVKSLMFKFIPFTAVTAANILNISLMRSNELTKGIQVKDENGIERGVSLKAGRQAVVETVISRVALVVPILFVPPIVYDGAMKTNFMKVNKWAHTPVNLTIVGACLMLGLPLAIGLFPQTKKVKSTDLETEFHHLKDENGKPIEHLYFNKGL